MAQRKRKSLGENPFNPGFGTAPPFLAGRAREKNTLGANLSRLAAGRVSTQALVLYGPRGMGKTVLAYQFEKECAAHGVRVVSTTASELLESRASLVNILFPWYTGLRSLGALLNRLAFNTALSEGEAHGLGQKLISKCKRKPLALLLDEAHLFTEIDRPLARGFLQMCQTTAAKSPFLLVLAGTPGLPGALRQLSATFVERGRFLNIGLLDQADAEMAIAEPLRQDGIAIAADALTYAAEDGQRYPYFLQLWGQALWDVANENGIATLAMSDAQNAKPRVDEARALLYQGRYEEVRRDKYLRAAAHAVAEAFACQDAVALDDLEDAAAEALRPSVAAADERERRAESSCEELARLGFVWKRIGSEEMIPGIPSLMDYTRAQNIKPARAP